MNVERILALADLIENQPHTSMDAAEGFNMVNWTHRCGTPSCIAGWAVAMARGDLSVKLPKAGDDGFYPRDEASAYLGLGVRERDELFEPAINYWVKITPAQAASTLRELAATGQVDWSSVPDDDGFCDDERDYDDE